MGFGGADGFHAGSGGGGGGTLTGADNGLSVSGTTVQLGGALIQPTLITALGANTFDILTSYGLIGIGSIASVALDIQAIGSGTVGINLNTSSTQDAKLHFRTNNAASARSQIYLEDATQTLNVYTVNNDTIFWNGNGLAQVKTLTLFTNTTAKFENNVGIAVSPNTSSRVIISGIDNTSAHYGLKIDDSVGNPLLYVRNDGDVTIGKTLRVRRYSFSPNSAFWMEANAIEDTEMNTLNADLVFKTKYSGGVNSESIRFTKEGVIKVADNNYLTLGAYNSVTNKYGYLSSASNTTAGVGLKLEVCQVGNTTGMTAMQIEAGGNIGIGTTSPTARTHIQGVDATSSNYALKVDNSASSPLLYVRNDAKIGISTILPTAKLQIQSTSFGADNWIGLSGSDFFGIASNNTGASILLGVNTGNNKQIWFADQDKLALNPTNPILSIGLFGTSPTSINSISTNGTVLNLVLQANGGNLGVSTGVSNPLAKAHILGIDSTTKANLRLEPVADVAEDTTGNTVNTTNNTTVALETIAIPTDTVVMIESYVTCRKTGGAGAGTTGDGNGYIRTVKAKNVGGVVTIGVVQSSFTSEDIAPLDATFAVSGTNVVLNVTGANNDNITWNSITKKYKVA